MNTVGGGRPQSPGPGSDDHRPSPGPGIHLRPWLGRVVVAIAVYPEQRDDPARLRASAWHVWTDHHYPGRKI